MEDRRAHERLDILEMTMRELQNTQKLNADSIMAIEKNTAEMVEIMKGAKGIMAIITMLAKFMAAVGAVYVLWHSFVTYIRGD